MSSQAPASTTSAVCPVRVLDISPAALGLLHHLALRLYRRETSTARFRLDMGVSFVAFRLPKPSIQGRSAEGKVSTWVLILLG